jgi:phosphonatase-like hydrolase
MVTLVNRIRLAVFDMAGTTVDDTVEGVPLVLRSYDEAFRRHGIVVPMKTLNDNRGRDKWAVIKEFGGEKASAVYRDFTEMLVSNTAKLKEMEGAGGVFRALKERGVHIAVESGFPALVTLGIIQHLRWQEDALIDYWTCSELVDEERPSPAMIRHCMRHLHVRSPSEVVKVDDTAVGVEEGINAKAHTVAVLTGTQSREKLQAAKPDAILPSVRELPAWLLEQKLL